jgi:hypothetical protein
VRVKIECREYNQRVVSNNAMPKARSSRDVSKLRIKVNTLAHKICKDCGFLYLVGAVAGCSLQQSKWQSSSLSSKGWSTQRTHTRSDKGPGMVTTRTKRKCEKKGPWRF